MTEMLLRNIKKYFDTIRQNHLRLRPQRSYSQTGEDRILLFALNSLGIRDPSYLDIGAHHPFHFNNTALLFSLGCRGINVEPNPVLFRRFVRYRRGDVNLNTGVLAHEGFFDFYLMQPDTMSTFSADLAHELVEKHGMRIVQVKKIPVMTINGIVRRYAAARPPVLLNIDAEGADEQILRSIDFSAWSPLVICCETRTYSTTGEGKKLTEIHSLLTSHGYTMLADTYLNSIFVLTAAWHKAAAPDIASCGAL